MNFIDLLKKAFSDSWTGGASIDPSTGKRGASNRFHAKGTFDDFEFKDLFNNDRWVRENRADTLGNPQFDRGGEKVYTNYYMPRSTNTPNILDDQKPDIEEYTPPLPDLDISSGRIPIDSRSIPGNRWNKARIPDPRTQVPRIRPTRPPLRISGPQISGLLGQQSNIRNRPPPRSVQRPPVTGPYNPQSLDSFAEYDQQRQREMARRQAIQNQRRTIRVPQDSNTAEAMRRAMGGYGQRTAPPTRPLLPPAGGPIAGRPAVPPRPLLPPTGGPIAGRPAVPTPQTPQGIPRTTGAPRGIAAALEQYRPSLQSQGAIADDSARRLAMDAASLARWLAPRTGIGAMLHSEDLGDPNEADDNAPWRTGGSVFPQTQGPRDSTEKVVTTQDSNGTKVVRTQQYPSEMPSTIDDTRESGQIMNIERLREMLEEAYFKRLFQ